MAQGKRRHRPKLLALLLFCALMAAATIVAYRFFLDSDRLKSFFEASVAHYTGIEMKIGGVQATLFPARVVATNLRLSVPKATATADRVEVRVDLRRLFSRDIAITTGDISGLALHLPEDPAAIPEIIRQVRDHVKATTGSPGDPPFSTHIATIAAAAHVYLGENPTPFAVADIRVDNILSARIGIHTAAALRAWGDAARLYGDVELLRAEIGHPWQADGSARFAGIQTERLPLTNSPEGRLEGDISFTPKDAGPGAEVHARLDAPSRPEITSTIEARGVWTGERVELDRVIWAASGAQLEGSGAIASARDWSATLRGAHASESALDAILALLERPRARFEADPGAQVALVDVVVDSLDGEWRVDRGSLDFSGISIVSAVDGPARAGIAQATRGLRGSLTAQGGVVTLREVRNDDLRVVGTLAPDRANNTLRVDLRGEADLARLPWTLLNERGDVERVRGRLAVTQFTGTFTAGAKLPEDIVLEAELRDADFRYLDGDVIVDLRGIRGRLATRGKDVATEISAVDAAGIPIKIVGHYGVKTRGWIGSVDGDPRSIVPQLFERSAYLARLQALSNAVGPSVFDLQVVSPSNSRDPLRATATRRDDGQSTLAARVEFDRGITAFSVQSSLPVQRVLDEYLPELSGEGSVRTTFDYDGQRRTFGVTIDATDCSVLSDTILRKSAGTGLKIKASGAAGKNWKLDTAEVTAGGAPFIKTTGPARDGLLPFEVQLAALPAFLPDGASAAGTVAGRLRTDGTQGEVEFVNAAVALDATLALDRVQGRILFGRDTFACDDFQIHGARSDCTVALRRDAGRWSGKVHGARLDVGAIVDWVDAARVLQPQREGVASRSLWTKPLLGELSFDVGELYYRRGRIESLRLRALGEERAIRFTEFAGRYGEGSLLGSLVILPGENTDAILKSAVKWTQLDGRALNDMLFPEDRGFFGILDGELTFEAPFGTAKEMIAAGNGSARFTGKNGSLGQIGFASKLLTVLKSTEVINLRAPTLRDKGLVFNTLRGGLTLTQGVMTLDGVKLDGGAYAMDAKGAIDFAKDSTDADVFVRVLESVGRIVRVVPLLGDLAAALSTDLIGVPVHFSGSPYDVQAGVMKASGKSVATTPLRAGEGAVKAVGEGFKRLIPGGANKNSDPPK